MEGAALFGDEAAYPLIRVFADGRIRDVRPTIMGERSETPV